MRMIIDANQIGRFLSESGDMAPIHGWLEKGGQLIYSNHEKLKRELMKSGRKAHNHFTALRRRDRAVQIDKGKVSQAMKEIEAENKKSHRERKSNDSHILGLARASGAKLLCTEDRGLEKDFKKIIKGKIYKRKKDHSRLLTKNACRKIKA